MATPFETSKKSFNAFKGHFTRAVKAFDALFKVKPRPTMETLEKTYNRVQKQLDSLFTSADNVITALEELDSAETSIDVQKELTEINAYYDKLLADQCDIESKFVEFKASHATPSSLPPPSAPPRSEPSRPTVRLTALAPPSWSGIKADFYTWQRKFIHIMEEAKISDELIQLCYLQNSKTIPPEYQTLITDCSTINEVWSRLEERVPKETIKYEIISQFRNLKPLTNKKTPTMLRNFANEISLFCRRMADIGIKKENYSCIILQDVYERLDHDIAVRYRSKNELRRELMQVVRQSTNRESEALQNVDEDLDSLCTFIRSEATTLELAKGVSQAEKPPSDRPSSFWPPKKLINIVQKTNSIENNGQHDGGSNEDPRNVVYKCVLGCENPHRLIDCDIYMNSTTAQKRDFVKNSSRCYVCLVTYHTARNCPKRKGGWKCKSCLENTHHWTLCSKQETQGGYATNWNASTTTFNPEMSFNKKDVPLGPQMALSHSGGSSNNTEETREPKPKDFAPMVVAEIKTGNGNWVKANCFLDTGSNSSLVRLKFAKQAMLHGCGVSNVQFDVAGGGIHRERAEEFEIHIRPLHGQDSFLIFTTGIKKPCSSVQPIPSGIFNKHEHLSEFKDKVHISGGEVDILIGNDYAPLIIAEKRISSPGSPDDSPSLAFTRLGCYIYGGLNNPPSRAVNNVLSVNATNKSEDTEHLKRFFYGDVIGVKPTSICVCSDSEIAESAFIKHVKKTTKMNEDGRVETSMPWRPGFPAKLPNNFYAAKEQMIRRENQVTRDGKLDEYNKEIKSLLERGVVRILCPEEAEKAAEQPAWYLNHRMIERPDKDTTKLRLVFDSARPYMGVSLNDALEKGPDYTNSLFRCFLRWRTYGIAVSGDMEKMFNQIATCLEDQPYHRFLWRYGDASAPTLVFEWGRVLFGDKPSPDLAGYAIRFLAENSKDQYPAGAEALEDSTYVDDVGYSAENSTDANKIIDEIEGILCRGKFSVKCWNSNSPDVDKNPNEDIVCFLGHIWDKKNDTVGMKFKEINKGENDKLTKRILMGMVARFWDPSGSLLPVTIRYRIHLQKLWHEGLSWDEPVSTDHVSVWTKNIQDMQKLQNFKVKRCLKPEEVNGPPQLHGFSDGGDDAYGTCVFIRWPTENEIKVQFVAAKAFVAPLKHKTTPRLELMGAVAMGRLMKEIETALSYEFEYKRFWTDSKVVMHWLNSTSSRYKPFVSSRIQEFQDTHENWTNEIRYVPSNDNPADCLTKPIPVEELAAWHNGNACEFLRLEEGLWPQNVKDFDVQPMKSLLEEKSTAPKSQKKRKKMRAVTTEKEVKSLNDNVMRINKLTAETDIQLDEMFSSWSQLKRAVSFLKRAISLRSFNVPLQSTPYDLKDAEKALFFICQKDLRLDLNQTKKRFLKLEPIFDEEGVIRAKGRLGKTELPEEKKHPVILPGEHPLVRLFALHHHRRLLHQGYRVVVANIANLGILIGGGTELLKAIAAKCFFCRTRRRSLLQQQMGVLPSFRVEQQKAPFASVAIDFFGNLQIKLSRNVSIKGSVMIVTCMTTRCVHLELCRTIDTDSFLRAWRRFTTVRGVHPNHVFSDGGGAFKGANKPLQEWISSWDTYVIQNEFEGTSFIFDWKFNVPTASHMNGVVESLIHSVRKGLDAAIKNYTRNVLSFEDWVTVLYEITYIINSRPLYPDGDPWMFKCISGNDILHPYGQPSIPQFAPDEIVNLRGMLRNVQGKIDSFWNCWLKHIPPQLNSRNKWFHARSNLEKGDYVLILESGMKNKSAPRSLWRKAIVVNTHPGTDGLVRSVTVKDAQHNEYVRPISKLCLVATRAELEN